jgi:rhamnulose-1-phosphate aldolase/alcohol dehydrogenase
MENRYVDDEARSAPLLWQIPEPLALRTYSARLLGKEPALVLHGGGNTSVKAKGRSLSGEEIDLLYVKGSGWDLATIEPAGHPAVRLEPLRRLRSLGSMTDEAMVNELRSNLLDAHAPTPSVETLLHAYLPARFVDHTHADAVLAVADQPDGERICREIYGDGLVWVPYVMPGFALARRCGDAYDRHVAKGKRAEVIILEKHGIFTFGDTAKESYDRMIKAVTLAEGYIEGRRRDPPRTPSPPDPSRAAAFLPRLRGVLARLALGPSERGPVITVRTSEAILAFLARPDAAGLVSIGCATPDHVLRTKPTALLLRGHSTEGRRSDDAKLANELTDAISAYGARYDAYFDQMCREKQVTRTKLDPWPRVILVAGLGILAVGRTKKESDAVADIYEHTIRVMADASAVGRYAPVSQGDLFDVEYWSLEQAKLKNAAPSELAGCIALVTGAASGIGAATGRHFAELGAHVVLVDIARGLEATVEAIGKQAPGRVVGVRADVTSEVDVSKAVSEACTTFGGLDVVVSNAGNAPEGALDTAEGEQRLRESLELNLLAHNHVARAASQVMKAQGRGGCLLFNASKSAFNPGPGFGPYAVAKAALVALMRQYAVDSAPHGIRSNAVNADRIRTDLFGGGVLESRAAARGLSVDEYFRANLLKREVLAEDVARAFAYLATARATTGAVIPVDGGNAAAFPR